MPERRTPPDLLAYVDLGGLHVRWRGGRGRLNFHPQPVPKSAPVLVATYAANSFDNQKVLTDMSLYFPRFVNVVAP